MFQVFGDEGQLCLVAAVVGLAPVLGWILVHNWYFRRITYFQSQVQHQDGRLVPAQPPRLLVGHLVEVYQSDNRLAAYHRFHEQLGEIVQIFWLWRPQVSIANLPMANHILRTHQKNYRKFPPNKLTQQLYSASVLTNHGDAWQQQRTLLQAIFSRQRVEGFHSMFIACSKQLVARWRAELKKTGDSWQHDIYPDLIALFLDIIGQAALGTNFGALQGDAEDLVTSFGDGTRRCLGETFALHEMIMVLAILLHQFTFRVESGDEAEMELGKFGPFISMLPKQSVHLTLNKRHIGDQTSVPTVPAQL